MLLRCTILLLLLSYAAPAQTLHIDSTKFITGNTPATYIKFSIPTSDKGIFFVGYITGAPGGIVPYCPYAGDNLMIGKIDSEQKISWIKIYGGNGDDEGLSACQTADGGYAVIGYTESNDGDVTGYKGNGDMLALRVDKTGNLIWCKCFGSSANDGCFSISNTPDYGLILLGYSNGNDGDVPFHYGGGLSEDWLLVKIDSNGNKQWSKDLGGTGDEGGAAYF